ncbi:MAG: c-type cytochrome [Caulobacterales bacterium]
MKWLLGWIAGLATVALMGAAVVGFGLFDATAVTPHYPPVAWLTHEAFIRSVVVRASLSPRPSAGRAEAFGRGFQVYEQNCVVCHGAPGVARQAWVNGMTPGPPYLLDSGRRWTQGQLTHIVAKGVKMTGMPAWELSLSPHDVDAVVAFLQDLPNVTAGDYAALRSRQRAGQPDPSAAPAGEARRKSGTSSQPGRSQAE